MGEVKRTPGDVRNGRIVNLTDEEGVIPDLVRRLDDVTDRLVGWRAPRLAAGTEREQYGEAKGYARGLAEALQLLLPEYTLEEIKWMNMHRHNRRSGGATG